MTLWFTVGCGWASRTPPDRCRGAARLTPGPCVTCSVSAALKNLSHTESIHTAARRATHDYKLELLVLKQPSCRCAAGAAPFLCCPPDPASFAVPDSMGCISAWLVACAMFGLFPRRSCDSPTAWITCPSAVPALRQLPINQRSTTRLQ